MKNKVVWLIVCSGILHAEDFIPEQHAQESAAQTPATQPHSVEPVIAPPPVITVDPVGDSERGNWYNKRNILLRARPVYEKIRTMAEEIARVVERLIEEYTPYGQRLQSELAELAINPTTIDTQLQKVTDQIKAIREQAAKPTEADQKQLLDLTETKRLLETLKREYAYLASMASGLQQSLDLMHSQGEQAQLLEQKAWHHYEMIDEMLNDKQADRLYEEMQAFRDNIEQIMVYITRDLAQFCTQTTQSFTEQKSRVQKTIEHVEGRGIAVVTKKQPDVTQQKPAETKKTEEAQSWFAWLTSPFVKFWHWFKNWLMGVSRS